MDNYGNFGNIADSRLIDLTYNKSECGEIFVSLSYEPTMKKLTIDIHNAKDLRSKDLGGDSDPYVKIWLVVDGKKKEKQKTNTVQKCLHPTFDESFSFIVSNEKIGRSSLQVTVVDYDRIGRNELLGEVTIGACNPSGPMEAQHWKEMLTRNGGTVSKWHYLKGE